MVAALYGAEHPYSRGILTPTTLANIEGADVADFERTYHTAGNATLILSGAFETELAVRHARYQFGHLAAKRRAARRIPAVAARHGRQIVKVHGDDASPVVAVDVAFVGGAGIDGSYAARLILQRVIAARLSALREGIAVTYGMAADYIPRHGPGEWRISGQLDAARAAEGIGRLQLALEELRGDPAVWKGDFVLARRQVVDELLTGVTSGSSAAADLAAIAAFDLPLDFFDRLIDELARVRPDDLRQIVAAELTDDAAVYGLFGPAAAVAAAAAAIDAR
jgi:predicted Zn-dependent peptidase